MNPFNSLHDLSISPSNHYAILRDITLMHVLQLKNMINALFSLNKAISVKVPSFLAENLLQICITESRLESAMIDQARIVPRLREAHCLRDSWTKLNLFPAKVK